MKEIQPYSIKRYIFWGTSSITLGLLAGVGILTIFGFGSRGILIVLLLSFPFLLFSSLYGFYKGLVKHYGFNSPACLFFGGKF